MSYVYAIADEYNTKIKIGVSVDPKRRIQQLKTGSANTIYMLTYFPGDRQLEQDILSKYKKVRYNGEWLEATKELLDYLNSMSSDRFIDWDDKGKLRSYKKLKRID